MGVSHARIDEDLPDHPKWAPLTDAAFRLGIRSICWARKPERQRKRPGFIPSAMLMNLARRAPAMAARMAEELVNAGKPMHEVGIWVPVEGGWQIHDFDDYGPATILDSERVSKSEAGRIGGRRSAAKRREANGSAQPKQSVPASEAPTEADDGASEAATRSTPEAPPKQASDQNSRSTWKLSGSPDPDRSGSDQIPPIPPVASPTSDASVRSSRRASPKTAIPAGYSLPSSVLAWGTTQKRWPEWWVINRFDAFCELAVAKSWRYADWNAALRNFLGNEIGYKRGPTELAHLAPTAGSTSSADAARLRAEAEARVLGRPA